MSKTLTLRGDKWTISPLTFGQLRAHAGDLKTVAGIESMPDETQLDAVCRLVAAGLTKTHGEVEVERVSHIIDLENFKEVIGALMGVSGLEVRPTDPVQEQIGTHSTDT